MNEKHRKDQFKRFDKLCGRTVFITLEYQEMFVKDY